MYVFLWLLFFLLCFLLVMFSSLDPLKMSLIVVLEIFLFFFFSLLLVSSLFPLSSVFLLFVWTPSLKVEGFLKS